MSETTNLKLKKHDNVETNTDKFDIENYLNGNFDKIDEHAGEVNTEISNIKKEQETQNTNIEENNSKIVELQTEKAKLETELKEMQEDFYQNSIRGQVSGEYIHVEDSSNCRARIGISGNSEQETSTTGKNKFNLGEESYTRIGVNVIINKNKIILNGTTTSSNNLFISGKLSAGYLYLGKFKAGTYRVTKFITSGKYEINSEIGEGTFAAYIRKSDGTSLSNIVGDTENKTGSTITLTEDTDLYFQIWINSGAVFTNYVLEWQLEEGNSTTDLEQFVPNMPSPDYPSEIKVVGSNVNLFNKDNYIKSKLYINKNENKFSEARMGKSFIFDISKYNKLTISKVSSERFGVFASVDYPQKDGVGTYLQDAATNATSFSYDFAKFNYLVVFYYFTRDTLTEQEILDSIKIVEGTEVGEYSKYGQGCVKVTKCNKNLINKNLLTNYQILEDTGKLLSNNTRLITPFIYLKKGTYSLSCNLSRFAYAIYNLDKSFNCFVTWKAFPNQIVLNSDCYIKIEFIINPTGSEQVSIKDITYLQLEKGNTTDYEEHEEQSYIMPVQKEKLQEDYFDFDNEEEVHIWNKLILTGEETWYTNINSGWKQNSHTFALLFSGVETNGQSDNAGNVVKSNNFKCANTAYLVWKPQNCISYYPAYKGGAIMINHQGISTETDFKAWLKSLYDAGTPVVIYYKLATPTRIAFTDEQKAVAKELNNARTYKNVTNITTDSKAILSLDYAKDLETLLNNTQALAVNNASEGV